MIRTLTLVAIASFVLCIGAFAGSFSIAGGPFAIRDWAIDRWDWSEHRGRHRHHDDDAAATLLEDGGAHITREFTWSGGAELDIEVPADVVYTQGPVARLTIAGPTDMVGRVQVRDGRIRIDNDRWDDARLKIMMTAPSVTRFDLSGSQNLVIENYKQDRLDVDISGDARVSAKGEARAVRLDIAGSGDADLAEVAMQDATIDISGSGHARLGPKGKVKVDVSGSGDVDLTAKPASLTSDISGSGHVSQPGVPN